MSKYHTLDDAQRLARLALSVLVSVHGRIAINVDH